MKAREIMYHFQKVGKWVFWETTCDQILYGDPEEEVTGIATAWTATNQALQEASEKGLNLFITHESPFLEQYVGSASGDELIMRKKRLLRERKITLMRCHDTWDRMPEFGIPDAWADFLGFDTEPRSPASFYKICLIDNLTVAETASAVLDKVRPLGQDTVLVLGDRSKRVRRMAVGTGAITRLPSMNLLAPDLILATDDGINSHAGGLWSLDLGLPLLVVNHATAEKPGMQAMAKYLKKVFPDVKTDYIDISLPYSSVS